MIPSLVPLRSIWKARTEYSINAGSRRLPHFFVPITCTNHRTRRQRLRLSLGGEVEKPLTLNFGGTFEDRERHSIVNTLECAGNTTQLAPSGECLAFSGQGSGRHGAVFRAHGCAMFLQSAGVKFTASTSCSEASMKSRQSSAFHSSIPIEKALDGDTLIATHHERSLRLREHHAFPRGSCTRLDRRGLLQMAH